MTWTIAAFFAWGFLSGCALGLWIGFSKPPVCKNCGDPYEGYD